MAWVILLMLSWATLAYAALIRLDVRHVGMKVLLALMSLQMLSG
ncbi:MAG: hypothetical protein AB8B96_05065 [Lysobacterales bacterium]